MKSDVKQTRHNVMLSLRFGTVGTAHDTSQAAGVDGGGVPMVARGALREYVDDTAEVLDHSFP